MSATNEPNKEEVEAESSQESSAAAAQPQASCVRKWTFLALFLCLLLLLLHVLSDKFAPYTSNARIQAFIIPIVPQVSGMLTEVNVENNQAVREDHVLAVVDPSKYEFAVNKAQADLQLATQTSEADVSAVATAQGNDAQCHIRVYQHPTQRADRTIPTRSQNSVDTSVNRSTSLVDAILFGL